MKNYELLKTVMTETRNATLAYHNYMYTDNEYVKGQKLYLREMHLLIFVGISGELTMSEIAEKMNITQGAATQIAGRLIKKKLIAKKKHPSDKRYSVIFLTDSGRHAYEDYMKYDQLRNEEIMSCFEDFSETDMNIILKYELLIQDICSGKVAGKTRL